MKIQIKRWDSGSVIFETDAETIGDAVKAALAVQQSLYCSDLRNANLSGANLRSADLRNADLSGVDLKHILAQTTILPDGDLIGWKQLKEKVICKLRIPAKAKRVGGLIGRKCRCEYAEVLEGSGNAIHDGTQYKEGETVRPDSYDDDPLVECSHGIHFFITRQEAEDYA